MAVPSAFNIVVAAIIVGTTVYGFIDLEQPITEEQARRLDSHGPQQPLFEREFYDGTSPTLNFLERVGGPDRGTCDFRGTPTRTMTLGGDYDETQGTFTLIDTNYTFFKGPLGWNDSRIVKERTRSVRYLRRYFGDFVDTPVAPLQPLRFNIVLRKLADSEKLVPCANTTALIGGWGFTGANLNYTGIYATTFAVSPGTAVHIRGGSRVYILYLVVSPGSRFSTKMELRQKLPSIFSTGSGALTHTTKFIDNFHEAESGFSDTSIATRLRGKTGGGIGRLSLRMTLGWPGRFHLA